MRPTRPNLHWGLRRRLLLRSGIAILCLGTLLIAWIAGARSLSLLLDRFHTVEVDAQPIVHLGVADANHAIALGRVGDSLGVKPQPGDKARFQIERSMLSWPTPLAINFMSGHSPSWKRHLYYRLVWENRDGGRLEMVWRYEQYFYEDWASGFMTRAGTTGLIHVDIRP